MASTHPGPWIRANVIPAKVTVSEAAKLLKVSRPALSNLLNGKAALSQDMAARLENVFGANARQLLERQTDFDAVQGRAKAPALATQPYVPPFLKIKAQAIEDWGGTGIEPRQRFSVFLRTLVNSTGAGLSLVDFPGNDDAERPGWDGEINASEATPWIPAGLSGWEFGVNADPKTKAEKDYTKSVRAVPTGERRERTFVFVTPRRWPGKTAWVAEKRADQEWRDVRAYDASDLEQWLEQSLSGQAWFANETGQLTEGVVSLDAIWKRWAADCQPALVPTLFAPAVEANRALIEKRLGETPARQIVIAADSKEEGMAFLSAFFSPTDDSASRFRDRLLVFEKPGSLPKLLAQGSNFIPVIVDGDVAKEFAPHRSIVPSFAIYPRNAANAEPDIVLETLNYEAFDKALKEMGLGRDRIDQLGRESARSPTILRRRLSQTPEIRTPEWAAETKIAVDLVPFILAGAWKSDNEADKYMLVTLAGDAPYEDLERRLASMVELDDAPVWRTGAFRGVVSKIDALFAVHGAVVATDLDRFFEVARVVLSEDDPSLELPEADRWAAAIYGKTRQISGALREGIAETLVLLAVYGPSLFKSALNIDPALLAERLVSDLLLPISPEKLESQTDNLPLYAEAAPDAFLTILENDLSGPDSATLALMRPMGDPMFGRASRTGVLWALESLAWAPERLTRTVLILGRLADRVIDDNLANKPIRSLESIFRAWMPQTSADLEGRTAAFMRLARAHPNAAWRIIVSQFQDSQIGHYSSKPKWRPDGHGYGEPLRARAEAIAFRATVFEMAVSWPSHTLGTVSDLVAIGPHLPPELQEKVWDAVLTWSTNAPEEDRARLREKIRVTSFGRRAVKRRGSAGNDRARQLYAALEPTDVILRHEWLFRQHWVEESFDEIEEAAYDFRKRDERITKQRRQALSDVYSERGLSGILELSKRGQAEHVIGSLLTDLLTTDENLESCVQQLISQSETRLLEGLLNKLSQRPEECIEALAEKLDLTGRLALAIAAPFRQQTWRMVDRLGSGLPELYWRECTVSWADEADVVFAVGRLLDVNRPRAAFTAAHFHLKDLPAKTLLLVMQALVARSDETTGTYLLDPHYINEAFELLTDWGQASVETMAALEYQFIDALDRDGGLPNLERYVSDHPEFFVRMVALAYRRSDGAEDSPEFRVENEDQKGAAASTAHAVLDRLKSLPGTDEHGIHEDRLHNWIADVRGRLAAISRADIGDQCIGKLLAASPAGEDGIWPSVPVRNVLEQVGNQHVGSGLTVALFNSRGAHWRGEGGEQERDLAQRYAGWASSLKYTHPRVAEILRSMEQTYLRDADWQDNEAQVRRRLRS